MGGSQEPSHSETVSRQNEQSPLELLHSSDTDKGEVCTVQMSDTGSYSQCARVLIQGVPVYGIVNTAVDITVIGGTLFQ